ncbi:hypothetical protein [Acinetobacter soli]|uniref:hypothetical protein n=1 Tax=Acinetobacter soli TaxID=487316 RepID=UPI00148EF198|nr:hypothetical protein [Acinetobacter soli]
MNDLCKQREVSEETMALVEAVLERLEFHAFEEVLIWSEENASKALRRCLKNTLNEFKSGKLILTSSYPKLKHYSVDSVINGLQTALTQAQEHQDNLNEQIDSLKAYRSDFEIIQQTIALVDLLATSTNVYQRDPSCLYPFESENPRVKEWWRTACKIQELLTNTDPENCDFDEYKKMIEAAQENSHE